MRSIPAFSKKSSEGPCVYGGGQRSGFTPHVKATKVSGPIPIKSMAGFQGKAMMTKHSGTTHKSVPAFKSHSGSAGKSVAAFSKKKI
jgi:hypothetical protein